MLFLFRLIVGGVFIWAGLLKILDPLAFVQSISDYRVFPREISFFAGLVLPWIEVICGVLVIAGIWQRASALILSGHLCAFLALIIVTMIRGIEIDCGCFGSLSQSVDYKLIVPDVILLFFSLNVFFRK